MKRWTIQVFVGARGRDAFEKWLDEEGTEVEEALSAMVKRLSNLRRELWARPFVAKLHGYEDVYEIIISTKDKEYRPLGCFGPGEQVFTILIGASKKGGRKRGPIVWDPPSAPETAEKRRKLVYQDRGYLRGYQPRTRSTKKEPSE